LENWFGVEKVGPGRGRWMKAPREGGKKGASWNQKNLALIRIDVHVSGSQGGILSLVRLDNTKGCLARRA